MFAVAHIEQQFNVLQSQSPNDTPADATPTPRFLNATGRRVRSPWTATRLKKKNRADHQDQLPGFSSDSENETEDQDVEPQDEGVQGS